MNDENFVDFKPYNHGYSHTVLCACYCIPQAKAKDQMAAME